MHKPILTWLRSSGPTWQYKRIWLDALIATLCLNVLAYVIFSKMGFTTFEIFEEDGPIEDLQSLVLAITVVLAVLAAFRTRILARFIAITTACIAVVFFMREMPICRGDVTVYCVSKTSLPIVLGATALVLLIATVLFELRHRGGLSRAIHPRLSWPLALIALILAAGQAAEHFDIVEAEETFESYGFMVLMMSAVWLFRFSRKQPVEPLKVRARAGFHKLMHPLSHR
ncbi:hypothetical protein [Rhizobium terrae]|uniref:hypothetical protein n=1 Tax=Rhizobium terrae TaxID=2171756 RepID=UPI000E3C65C1|nr:hypothetical protein [Rhizobium terrae]